MYSILFYSVLWLFSAFVYFCSVMFSSVLIWAVFLKSAVEIIGGNGSALCLGLLRCFGKPSCGQVYVIPLCSLINSIVFYNLYCSIFCSVLFCSAVFNSTQFCSVFYFILFSSRSLFSKYSVLLYSDFCIVFCSVSLCIILFCSFLLYFVLF